jgi:hypothetical protein
MMLLAFPDQEFCDSGGQERAEMIEFQRHPECCFISTKSSFSLSKCFP